MSENLKDLLGEDVSSYFQYRKKDKCCKRNKCHKWDGKTLISDYLIIGGGTAGNVVARRLTDDLKSSAIVFEDGENNDKDFAICCAPGGAEPPSFEGLQTQGVSYNKYMYPNQTDWDQTAPPPEGRRLMFTTGRTWGGGSSVNSSVWVHPSAGMISEWQNDFLGGDPSWSPEAVGGYIKAIETYLGQSQDQSARGHHGPSNVRQLTVGSTEQLIQNAVLASTPGTGVEPILDYNTQPLSGPPLCSCQAMQLSQYANKTRSSSSISWLPEGTVVRSVGESADSKYAIGINGRRLLVLFKSMVMRILFDKKNSTPRAIGVEWLHNGYAVYRAYARRSVIVSAGLLTAQTLQRSGVGPRDVLECAKVKVIAENPNIGARLKDHPLLLPTFLAPELLTPGDPDTNWATINFLPDARGIDPTRRAVEFYPILTPIDLGGGVFYTAITFVMEYLRPTSSGYIKILSGDPLKSASVSYGWLNQFDIDGIVAFFQLYLQNFQNVTGWPMISPTAFDTATLTSWINSTVDTSFHYGCAVTMGLPENGGGVDGSGRVYGTDRLYVIDNSNQPAPNDGNTQMAAFIIGYKMSGDIIVADADAKVCRRKYKF